MRSCNGGVRPGRPTGRPSAHSAHRDHLVRVIVITGRGRCAALSAAISLVLRLLGKNLGDIRRATRPPLRAAS